MAGFEVITEVHGLPRQMRTALFPGGGPWGPPRGGVERHPYSRQDSGRVDEFTTDKRQREDAAKTEQERLEQRLASVRRRLDQAYVDKLDGKIAEEFWERKSAEWQEEERRILSARRAVNTQPAERLLDAARILELANKAYSLYLRQGPPERSKLLRIVLSNCSIDAVNVYPAYRNPFDLIFKRTKSKEWWTW